MLHPLKKSWSNFFTIPQSSIAIGFSQVICKAEDVRDVVVCSEDKAAFHCETWKPNILKINLVGSVCKLWSQIYLVFCKGPNT